MTTMITIHHVADGTGAEFRKDITLSQVALDKVLFDFNVTADPRTTALKAICAGAIQMMLEHQDAQRVAPPVEPTGGDLVRAARGRGAAIAITLVEGAQMALVKSLFAKA